MFEITFLNGSQHPVGSSIKLARVTCLTCKANVQLTNTSHTRIDSVYVYKRIEMTVYSDMIDYSKKL